MTTLSDSEIHQIVQRVLAQATGQGPAQPAAPTASQAAPRGAVTEPAGSPSRIVVIGADHGGVELKEILKADLAEQGYDVRDVGTYTKAAVDYPEFAHEVARRVASGKAWRGIMIDGAGIGSCIVANKVPGIRAGMAYDLSSALNSREHNDTNVLTLGAGLIGPNLARQIVKTWLTTEFGGGRHAQRVDGITAVEKQYLK